MNQNGSYRMFEVIMELKNFDIDLRRSKNAKTGLVNLCEYLKENSDFPLRSITEIGSFSGVSAWIFSHYFNKVIAVDPWQSNYSSIDDASDPNKFNMVEVEAQFDRIAEERGNIHKIKKSSEEAVKSFPDVSLEFVYLDGNHEYEALRQDIMLWLPKIRIGGFLCGHDIKQKRFPGVTKAVKELLGEPDISFLDTSYAVELTEERYKKVIELL